MSKVKNYMDSNKEKARHRNRIDETRRTKANRIRKCNNWTYSVLRGGYYHVTEHESYRYEYIQNKPIEINKTDWDNYFKTGERITHKEIGIYPIHKEIVETRIKPVSILKRGSTRRAKHYKTRAKRRFRRQTRLINEDSYLLKGNTYRKDYDIHWRIW